MAIYRFEMKAVSRREGRSAVAAAAYRASEQLFDERTDQEHDYRRRSGVAHSEILVPPGAPDSLRDRSGLWNAAEAAEKRKDAKVAREAILALPHELDGPQQQEAARQFARYLVDRYGVAVDMSVHAPDRDGDRRNWHTHLLMTTREITAEGLGAKTRQLDVRSSASLEVEHLRASWAGFANRALERAGRPERVDHRSLERQGLDREPEPKLGPIATVMEREGRSSHAGDDIRAVRTRNAEREDLARQGNVIDLEIERERRRMEAARAAQERRPAEKPRRTLTELLEDRQASELAGFYEEAARDENQLTRHLDATYRDREAALSRKAEALEETFATKNRFQILLSQLTGRLGWNARKELETTRAHLDYIDKQRATAVDDQARDRKNRLHQLLERHQSEPPAAEQARQPEPEPRARAVGDDQAGNPQNRLQQRLERLRAEPAAAERGQQAEPDHKAPDAGERRAAPDFSPSPRGPSHGRGR